MNFHVCHIVPTKLLIHLNDHRSALISERMRGKRDAAPLAAFAAVPAGELRRTVYDAQQKKKLPGKLVLGEVGNNIPPGTDTAVKEAYDGAGKTYAFYREILKRNSIDGNGLRIDSSVHYEKAFNNAFWDGKQMVYGDGDGLSFRGFTGALDVVAHELTHGVTQYTVPGGGLVYQDQSGALNESISDVFGSVVKQYTNNETASHADWLIGAGIMLGQEYHALRSMKDPGNTSLTYPSDDQPKDMSGYVVGGDVHTNSGIPNRAFYLAATTLGGNSWDKAGPIWYRALGLLTPNATFEDAAKATSQSATILYPDDATVKAAIDDAWKTVGVI